MLNSEREQLVSRANMAMHVHKCQTIRRDASSERPWHKSTNQHPKSSGLSTFLIAEPTPDHQLTLRADLHIPSARCGFRDHTTLSLW